MLDLYGSIQTKGRKGSLNGPGTTALSKSTEFDRLVQINWIRKWYASYAHTALVLMR
jgi:hypothetical protein